MSKVTSLESALRQHIRPGMKLHLTTQCRAATRAIQRVFRGEELALTLIMGRIGGGHAGDLLASGLVRAVIAGSYGAVSRQHTGPLAQVQQVFAQGEVRFQNWSFWSLMQRLMAGAQGFPFLPTHSLAGSTMAADSGGDYFERADPNDATAQIGAVRALHPDLSIVHVAAADEDGNAIMVPPLEEGAWGAKASRDGAIVTAERIVDRSFITRHAHLVRLPGIYVRAVCHTPFGAHPGPFGNAVVFPEDGYGEDETFNRAYFTAVRDPALLAQWVDEWVHGTATHEAYLERLGTTRLAALRTATAKGDVPARTRRTTPSDRVTDNERVMTLALRHILRRIAEGRIDVILVGAGLSEVPGTAASVLLKQQGRAVTLVMGHGYFGFEPSIATADPDAASATMTTDPAEIYGVLLGGGPVRGMALLGAAQVDRFGNLNSTLVGGRLLVGSGGSNDAASVCETVVVTRSSRSRLVERVDYITCPGRRVRAVITEKGVFEKQEGQAGLVLTRVFASRSDEADGAIAQMRESCGWDVEASADLQLEPPPSESELSTLRGLMPERYE